MFIQYVHISIWYVYVYICISYDKIYITVLYIFMIQIFILFIHLEDKFIWYVQEYFYMIHLFTPNKNLYQIQPLIKERKPETSKTSKEEPI